MPDARIRVALVDDHPLVLGGLKDLFGRDASFDVMACCRTGTEALEVVRRTPPDVLVLDLRMPGIGGLDVLRAIAGEQIACRVVLLTATLREAEVTEVMRLGAMGLVLKEAPPEDLVECVRRVHAGEIWIDRALLTRAFDRRLQAESPVHAPSRALTPRELEIVRMVGLGLRNRDIGQRLSISEGTVKIHLHNTYEKLGVDGRVELLLYAQDKGLI